jgi:hypothetical protein
MNKVNDVFWALLAVACGVLLGYFLFKPTESTFNANDKLTRDLQTWQLKAQNLGADLEAAVLLADSFQTQASYFENQLQAIKNTPRTVNYLDSLDHQIAEGFNRAFGPGIGRKIPIPRDQLGKALNSVDSLNQAREIIEAQEGIIDNLEGAYESLQEGLSISEERASILDTALSACKEDRQKIKADSQKLSEKLETEKVGKKRWKIVALTSMAINAAKTWLHLTK